MQFTKRGVAVVTVAVAVGALGAPAGYSAAKDAAQSVFVTNDDTSPVSTKAVGTTAISGSVSVPGGVAVNGKPSVAVPDGVSINGPVAVQSEAPTRFNQRTGAYNTGGGETCNPVDVPEGKRLVVEAVHFEATNGDLADMYLRQVSEVDGSGFLLDRFRPAPSAGTTGRLEGPFIHDSKSRLSICARNLATTDVVVVGILENQ